MRVEGTRRASRVMVFMRPLLVRELDPFAGPEAVRGAASAPCGLVEGLML